MEKLRTFAERLNTSSPYSRVIGMLVPVLAAITALPIILTPYGGDDTINHSTWPNLEDPYEFAGENTLNWIKNEGRFYPATFFYMAWVFSTFTTRFGYKIWLFVLAIVAVASIYKLLQKLKLSTLAAQLSTLFFISAMAIRFQWDPWTQFHGLVPLTIILGIWGTVLLLRATELVNPALFALGTSLIWFAGLLYELGYLFLPLAIFLLRKNLVGIKFSLAAGIISIPFLTSISIVVLHRAKGLASNSKYEYHFSNWNGTVFLRQLQDSLPVGFRDGALGFGDGHIAFTPALLLFIIATGLFILSLLKKHQFELKGSQNSLIGVLPALGFLLLPPAVLSFSGYWSKDPDVLLPYIFGPYQSLGLAILLAIAIETISSKFPKQSQFFARVSTSVLLAAAVVTAAGNWSVVESTIPGERSVKEVTQCKNLPWEC